MIEPSRVQLSPANAADADEFARLRASAMKESLERIGRFDEERARERFLSGFNAANTRHILLDGNKVGVIVVKVRERDILLDHLYVKPECQGGGIGSEVVRRLITDAQRVNMPIRVGALRSSASNRFYASHGFKLEREEEWDLYYVALPGPKD